MEHSNVSISPVSNSLCVSPQSPSRNLSSLAEHGESLKSAVAEKNRSTENLVANQSFDGSDRTALAADMVGGTDINEIESLKSLSATTVGSLKDLEVDTESDLTKALRKKFSISQHVEMHAFRDAIDVNYQRMALTEDELSGVCFFYEYYMFLFVYIETIC